jgi:hypothetical protein
MYPLYSVLFVGLLHAAAAWPLGESIVEIWRAHYWIVIIDQCAWNAALALGICFGIVGLFRSGWIPKILSCAGLWLSIRILIPPFWDPMRWLYTEVTWYLFDIPRSVVVEMAGGNSSVETMLWACYLFLLWLALRPMLKVAYRRIRRLETSIISRWPAMSKLSRPIV